MNNNCDIGLIGLAVMGENLALNIESRGFRIAVYNRTVSKVDELLAGRAKGKNFVGCHSLEELVGSLASPRKVMLMVKAGPAVDEFIEKLIPLLSPGDVIIDGGNTLFSETERRTKYVESKGLLYIGTGVSGGEEGALKGPSMMPGGSTEAWPLVKPIFQAIAAKVGPNEDIPCCEWVGPRGAGHYVKMVHNGIEYGDMQLICEAYWMLKQAVGLTNDELYDVFQQWYKGDLNSYLIEITRDIFSVRDPDTGGYLVDMILDTAGAKGTGKWMSQLALDLGVPSTLVTEAVYARSVRDSQCLRGKYDPSSIDIITVGNSTTDQRYLSEGETWQDSLAKYFREHGRSLSIANAGVDGQSTIGHLWNFEYWFKNLSTQPRYYLFYLGGGDLYRTVPNAGYDDQVQTVRAVDTIKNTIKAKSALYQLYRTLVGMQAAQKMEVYHKSVDFSAVSYTSKGLINDFSFYDDYLRKDFLPRLEALTKETRALGSQPIFVTQRSNTWRERDGRIIGTSTTSTVGGLEINGMDRYRMESAIAAAILNFCKERNLICVDSRPATGAPDDFYDWVHNTPSGAEKLGAYIGAELFKAIKP